jgi:hypothetical protein
MATNEQRLPDRGRDRRRLQSVERRFQTLVIPGANAASDEGENLVRRRRHEARGLQAGVARLDDLRGGPDKDIGVPDRGHAMFRDSLDAN